MKKSLKKHLALVCTAVIAASSLFGCGGKEEALTEGNGEMPEKLTIFSSLGPSASKAGAKDNNDILSFKLMEEMTGCHVEWTHPVADAYDEKFKLLVASGNYPDIIAYHWAYATGGPLLYKDDEVIVSLTDKVDKNMPNFSKILKDHPEYKRQLSENGEILYIPFIRGDKELRVFLGPQIRQDWLDKLGLEQPKTTDDLYNVLKAFKEQDPNGNGKADEIPMTGSTFESPVFGIGNLLWAFGTMSDDYYLKNNKVTYGIMEDEFEEGLRYINKLYKDGLIDKDYLVNNREKMDSKVINDKAGFYYSYQPSNLYGKIGDSGKVINGISHLSGPGGEKKCYVGEYICDVNSMSAAVTTSCKNPDGALKWLDAFYSDKGREYMNFGKEGESFEYVDGYPKLTDKVLNNPDMDRSCSTALNIGAYESTFPTMQDWRYYEQMLSPWGRDAISKWTDCDTTGILPQMKLNEEENEIVTQKMAQIETYVSEAVNKMVIGKQSIDELPEVREKLKKIGIDEVIEIYQKKYDAYMAN